MRSISRLRLAMTIALIACAAVAAIATWTTALSPGVGAFLTVLLAAFAMVSGELEKLLQRAETAQHGQDEADAERARLLEDRARQDVLAQVRRAWVQPKLADSAPVGVRVTLALTSSASSVDAPLRAASQPALAATVPEPSRETIRDAFEAAGHQLLILGEPGSGKTTLLMELTEQLIGDAERTPTLPLPVVFNLAGWSRGRQSLAEWLAEELHRRYGLPRALAETWILRDQVVPLLDGLDEVADRDRDDCVRFINAYHDVHGIQPLVVTARIAEYESVPTKLQLRGAVRIEPLPRDAIDGYLASAKETSRGLRDLVRRDRDVAALLAAPLFLQMAMLAFRQGAASFTGAGSLERRRRSLVAAFIDAMLSGDSADARYSRPRVDRYLGWLGRSLLTHGEALLYIDWIQPAWIERSRQRWIPSAGASLVAGLAAALVSCIPTSLVLSAGPKLPWQTTAVVIAIPAVIVGAIVGWIAHARDIEPTESLHLSRAVLRRNFRKWASRAGLGFALIFGIGGGVMFGLLASSRFSAGGSISFGLAAGIVFAIPGAVVVGTLVGLASGLQPSEYVARPGPGVAIGRSGRNGLVSGLIATVGVGVTAGLVIWSVIWLASGLLIGVYERRFFVPTDMTASGAIGPMAYKVVVGPAVGVLLGVPLGLLVGIVVAFQRGVGAFLRHYITRAVLILDRATPRDWVAFLEYARRHAVLRARGGGYEFMHPLVLSHFAGLDVQEPDQAPRPAIRDRATG